MNLLNDADFEIQAHTKHGPNSSPKSAPMTEFPTSHPVRLTLGYVREEALGLPFLACTQFAAEVTCVTATFRG